MQLKVATLSQTQKKNNEFTKFDQKKKRNRQECKLNIQVLKKLTKMTAGYNPFTIS